MLSQFVSFKNAIRSNESKTLCKQAAIKTFQIALTIIDSTLVSRFSLFPLPLCSVSLHFRSPSTVTQATSQAYSPSLPKPDFSLTFSLSRSFILLATLPAAMPHPKKKVLNKTISAIMHLPIPAQGRSYGHQHMRNGAPNSQQMVAATTTTSTSADGDNGLSPSRADAERPFSRSSFSSLLFLLLRVGRMGFLELLERERGEI